MAKDNQSTILSNYTNACRFHVQTSTRTVVQNVLMGWAHISTLFEGYIHPEERVEDSMKSLLTPDADVTEMERMKRKSALAKVQQQNKEILKEISLNRKNPISDNV